MQHVPRQNDYHRPQQTRIVQTEFHEKDNVDWKRGYVPCFDYVGERKQCIKKGKALSNIPCKRSPRKLDRAEAAGANPEEDAEVELVDPLQEEQPQSKAV